MQSYAGDTDYVDSEEDDSNEDQWLEGCRVYTNLDTFRQQQVHEMVEDMKTKEQNDHKEHASMIFDDAPSDENDENYRMSVNPPNEEKCKTLGLSGISR